MHLLLVVLFKLIFCQSFDDNSNIKANNFSVNIFKSGQIEQSSAIPVNNEQRQENFTKIIKVLYHKPNYKFSVFKFDCSIVPQQNNHLHLTSYIFQQLRL